MTKLFVYGTLKKGFYNHTRYGFDESTPLNLKAEVNGVSLVQKKDLPYPFAIPDDQGSVTGELYEVDDDCLQALDRMEKGAGYSRLPVETLDGIKCFTYVDLVNKHEGLPRFTTFKK